MRMYFKALLSLSVAAILMSGCGMDTNTFWGAHDKTVVTKRSPKVVSGSVYCPGWTVSSINVCGTTSTSIGVDSSFYVENVTCAGLPVPYAEATISKIDGAGNYVERKAMYYLQAASILATADVVIESPYDWYGKTGTIYYVPGNGNAVLITELTDFAYRLADPSKPLSFDYTSAKNRTNAYLNTELSTSNVDYVASPTPPAIETTALATNVAVGTVSFPGASVNSISICGTTTTRIGVNGSFAVGGVDCSTLPVPSATVSVAQNGQTRQVTTYFPGGILPVATIVTSSPAAWNGIIGKSYAVSGTASTFTINELTGIAYQLALKTQPFNYAAAKTNLNNYLNSYFITTGLDYVAGESYSSDVLAAALNLL